MNIYVDRPVCSCYVLCTCAILVDFYISITVNLCNCHQSKANTSQPSCKPTTMFSQPSIQTKRFLLPIITLTTGDSRHRLSRETVQYCVCPARPRPPFSADMFPAFFLYIFTFFFSLSLFPTVPSLPFRLPFYTRTQTLFRLSPSLVADGQNASRSRHICSITAHPLSPSLSPPLSAL